MAILVSKSDTASFTNNEWYRAEAYNPTAKHTTGINLTTTALAIPVTFLNAGNCQGVIICLRTGLTNRTLNTLKDVIVDLQESVASVWTTRATKTMTTTDINTGVSPAGSWFVPFEFATPYAVDTTASKWRFTVRSGATLTNHYQICTSNGTAPFYIAWCDTQITPTSGADMLVAKNYVDMNSTFTLKGYLGTGETVNGYCAITCRNLDPTPDNVAYWRCLTPAAPYVLTLDGIFAMSCHSGFRLGTENTPIPVVNRFKISFENATVGSSVNSYFTDQYNQQGTNGKWSFFTYGEYPAQQMTTLTATVAAGVTAITVADSSIFTTNDRIMIGKRNTETDAGITRYVVTSVAGNTVNFTPALATDNATTGGYVMKIKNTATNLSGFGVEIMRVEGAAKAFINFILYAGWINNLHCEGTYFQLATVSGGGGASGFADDDAYTTPIKFKNCLMVNNISEQSFGLAYSYFILNMTLARKGLIFENCYFTRQSPFPTLTNATPSFIGNPAIGYMGGDIYITNMFIFGPSANNATFGPNSNIKYFIDGLYAENYGGGNAGLILSGYDSIFNNVEIWGSRGDSNYGALRLWGSINPTFTNLKINKCNVGINFEGTSSGALFNNTAFGDLVANTTDIGAFPSAYFNGTFKTVTGNIILAQKQIPFLGGSSQIKFENKNAAKADFIYKPSGTIIRTGSGLSDPMVRNGNYAMRFESKASASENRLEWTQTIPTGNVQNKSMSIGVWSKIQNSSYYTEPNNIMYFDGSDDYVATGITSNDYTNATIEFDIVTSSITSQILFVGQQYYSLGQIDNIGSVCDSNCGIPVWEIDGNRLIGSGANGQVYRSQLYNSLVDGKRHHCKISNVNLSGFTKIDIGGNVTGSPTLRLIGNIYNVTIDNNSDGTITHKWTGYGNTDTEWQDLVGNKNCTVYGSPTLTVIDTPTFELPKLTVTYDGLSTVVATANQTTDWQNLSVTFSPTTTINTVSVTLSSKSYALGNLSHVYWDDFAVNYPTDHELDLSKLEDWNSGEPLMPTLPIIDPNAGGNIFIMSE